MDTAADRAALEQYAQDKEQHAEWRARRAAGMGFFRLVLVVALGVLLAQGIGIVLSAVVQFVSAHVIPQ